jgi:hypothetical protein
LLQLLPSQRLLRVSRRGRDKALTMHFHGDRVAFAIRSLAFLAASSVSYLMVIYFKLFSIDLKIKYSSFVKTPRQPVIRIQFGCGGQKKARTTNLFNSRPRCQPAPRVRYCRWQSVQGFQANLQIPIMLT